MSTHAFQNSWVRLAVLLPTAGLTLAVTFGCVRERVGVFVADGPPDFNPRMRVDRSGLSSGQSGSDPGLGAYRDGSPAEDETVSALLPVLPDGQAERLLQSDCFWAASGASEVEPVDFLRFSWEAVVKEANGALVYGDQQVSGPIGLCRMHNVLTGEGIRICPDEFPTEEEYENAPPGMWQLPGPWVLPLIAAEEEDGCTRPLVRDADLPRMSDVLFQRVSPAMSGDECPASLTDPVTPGPGIDELRTQDLSENRVARFEGDVHAAISGEDEMSGCVLGLDFPVFEDGSYRVAVEQSSTDPIVEWLGPNIRTVQERRTIERRMTQADGEDVYLWSTSAVDRRLIPTVENRSIVRWHENFSPNVLVDTVRIFKRDSSGNEAPVSDSAQPLQLAGFARIGDSDQPTPVSLCDGEDDGSANVFLIHSETGEPDCGVGDGASEGVTPTYRIADLLSSDGAIRRPLSWVIVPTETIASNEEVIIEFTLRSHRRGAALSADPIYDADSVSLGDQRRGTIRVTNVGQTTVEIESLEITGSYASDFEALLLGDELFLPAPVEMIPTGNGWDLELSLLEDAESVEALFEVREDIAGRSFRVLDADHDGAILTFYGQEVSFAQGVPIALGSNPFFDVQPTQPEGVLPAGRIVNAERSLPFLLAPGETFDVSVSARPTGYGTRSASLDVSYHQASDPSIKGTIRSVLQVAGIAGPTVNLLPATAQITAGTTRRVLIENVGNLSMTRSSVSLVGAAASSFQLMSSHSGSQSIGPGEAETFEVLYDPAVLPPFDAPDEAQLEVVTDAVNGTRATFDLYGRSPLSQPGTLYFRLDETNRELRLDHIGGSTLERRDVTIDGPDANLFAFTVGPSQTWEGLTPGDDRQWWLRYSPLCSLPAPIDGWRHAQVIVETDRGAVVVELRGEYEYGC